MTQAAEAITGDGGGYTTFIVGLCGSGKTALASLIKQRHPDCRIFDEEFLRDRRQHRELFDRIRTGRRSVVIEIAFCLPKYRRWMLGYLAKKFPGTQINWIFFENDLRSANWNCSYRKNKNPGSIQKHWKINKRLTAQYVIPSGASSRPVLRFGGPNE
jgi:hypothetical protein